MYYMKIFLKYIGKRKKWVVEFFLGKGNYNIIFCYINLSVQKSVWVIVSIC